MTTSAVMTQDPKAETEQEFLSFRIGDQDYCIDIMRVREIRSATDVTSLPKSPDYIMGVINLRGTVLPIMDLSRRLCIDLSDEKPRSVFIVVATETQIIGLLVDAVSDILSIAHEDIQPPPDMPSSEEDNFISGLTIIDDRMIRVLDLEATLGPTNEVRP